MLEQMALEKLAVPHKAEFGPETLRAHVGRASTGRYGSTCCNGIYYLSFCFLFSPRAFHSTSALHN